MTRELAGNFYDLATVEREIRLDISRYETLARTPAELAVRIRTHPSLSITSPLKMRSAAVAEMTYSGHRVQTTRFRHQDVEWLGRESLGLRVP